MPKHFSAWNFGIGAGPPWAIDTKGIVRAAATAEATRRLDFFTSILLCLCGLGCLFRRPSDRHPLPLRSPRAPEEGASVQRTQLPRAKVRPGAGGRVALR